MRRFTRTHVTASLVITGALVLAGCSGDDPGSMTGMDHGSASPGTSPTEGATTPTGDHNAADVEFATGMIPHHRQAVEMADLALKKTTNTELKQLATAIKAAQDPEIQQMSGWLTSWGEMVPTPGMGHTMGDPMPGMMTEEEMAELDKANGTAFDRMFLQMMVKHHQGAVTMAKAEQTSGKDTRVIELAKKIEADQTREITTMNALLADLPS